MRIGVFDSGIGGINVLSCLIKKYPNNEYIFYGDTENLPYGDKTKDELIKLSSKAIDFLLARHVDLVIIACGTVSSCCYQELKEKYQIPLYDIISPTIEYLKKCNLNRIGVIGTKRTIESGKFNIDGKHILTKATPNFATIIEKNSIENDKELIIDKLTIFDNYDLLVLGCTHYPVLKSLIEENIHTKTLDMGEVLVDNIKLNNDGNYKCELYFSLISPSLVKNIDNILDKEYKIFAKQKRA